jgi:hypothetical protein
VVDPCDLRRQLPVQPLASRGGTAVRLEEQLIELRIAPALSPAKLPYCHCRFEGVSFLLAPEAAEAELAAAEAAEAELAAAEAAEAGLTELAAEAGLTELAATEAGLAADLTKLDAHHLEAPTQRRPDW